MTKDEFINNRKVVSQEDWEKIVEEYKKMLKNFFTPTSEMLGNELEKTIALFSLNDVELYNLEYFLNNSRLGKKRNKLGWTAVAGLIAGLRFVSTNKLNKIPKTENKYIS